MGIFAKSFKKEWYNFFTKKDTEAYEGLLTYPRCWKGQMQYYLEWKLHEPLDVM